MQICVMERRATWAFSGLRFLLRKESIHGSPLGVKRNGEMEPGPLRKGLFIGRGTLIRIKRFYENIDGTTKRRLDDYCTGNAFELWFLSRSGIYEPLPTHH